MGFEKTGDWARAAKLIPELPPRVRKAVQAAIVQEAHFLRKKIVEEFQKGAPADGGQWAPHSPMTLAIRSLTGNRKSKLLIQSGDLRNSVGVVALPDGGAFVGVKRSAASAGKLSIVNLAMVHEGGARISITMTDPMRRLLFAAMKKAGIEPRDAGRRAAGSSQPHTITIVIPPRPFLEPVFRVYGKPADLEASIAARVGKLLGGDLGETGGTPRQ